MRELPAALALVLTLGAAAGVCAPAGTGEARVPATSAAAAAQTDLPLLPADFQRGMNLEPIGDFGGDLDLDDLPADLEELRALGVDHVALIPSFFQRRLGDTSFVWRGGADAVDANTRAAIRAAHAAGMRVLLKPHLWLEDRSGGAWRGDILPASDAWPDWRESYREALVGYARMAAEEGVAAISIGSELTALTLARPDFWRDMVAEVRAVFPGTVTYAANWDREFAGIDWWDAVDLIGVDAFWPLLESVDETPELGRLSGRLEAIAGDLATVSRRFDRPVLLTEIGYKSATGAAYRPWEWHSGREHVADPEAQRVVYEAIARVFGRAAGEGWLDGAYFWVWYVDARWAGPGNSDFTPRGKPAADVLAAWFRRP